MKGEKHAGQQCNNLLLNRAASLILIVTLLSRCGSVISGEFTRDGKPFDFARPPCQATFVEPPSDAVDIRYLGSGGVYLGWRGNAILLGPFFSNPSLIRAQFGKLRHDTARICRSMQNVAPGSVRAILVGHSHYDHIGDVPVIARELAPAAFIYSNPTGTKMLAAYPDLRERTRTVDVRPIDITDSSGNAVMRVHAVRSDHAPQLCAWRHWPCAFANGTLAQEWTTPFEEHYLRDFNGGQTYAYVIDLLLGGEIRYRVYYNDAAADAPLGIPPPALLNDHSYDLAILCMASYDFVKDYPDLLLTTITPRHVVLSHYENFFARRERRWQFVPLLTNAKANTFMRVLRDRRAIINPLPPARGVCGPSTDEWTMPVPAEQLLFRPDGR